MYYFRRNKFVYGVSPMFVNNLYDFFQMNFMLQVVCILDYNILVNINKLIIKKTVTKSVIFENRFVFS